MLLLLLLLLLWCCFLRLLIGEMVSETHKYRIKLQPPVTQSAKKYASSKYKIKKRKHQPILIPSTRISFQASDPKTSISAISPSKLGTSGYTKFSKIAAVKMQTSSNSLQGVCKTIPPQSTIATFHLGVLEIVLFLPECGRKILAKAGKRVFLCKLCIVCMVGISEMGYNIIQIN